MALESELGHLKIPLEDIKLATNNFDNNNLIGQGGSGKVYKGQLSLPASSSHSNEHSTTTVAVKRLDIKHGQGRREFLTEVVMLSSYKHENLISLVGFSEEGDEKIIVYKHEVRGSLDKYLGTRDITRVQWLQICLGAARGLNYLHSGVGEGHRVLHRDIKSPNILLDENWEAKISDFGLSKIGPTNQKVTFLASNACGTYGYVDPLYVKTGILTKESDVYSFGVVLFEVLCGRLAMIEQYDDERKFLAPLAKLHYEEGKLDEIIAPNFQKQITPKSLKAFSTIAYQCLKKDRKQRPSIELIIEELQNALELQSDCRRSTRIGYWGSSTGGDPWSYMLESYHKLRKITIYHTDWIYAISFSIEHRNGSLCHSPKHGDTGPHTDCKIEEINFDVNEELVGISGTVGETPKINASLMVITSLVFDTNERRHGPLGKETGTPFSVHWDLGSFMGFDGRAGFYLDGIGCHVLDGASICI